MEWVIFSATILVISYIIISALKQEKEREAELNFHLMQAKNILSSNDMEDKRAILINRFQQAETHLMNAQASCARSFEHKSITDIRAMMDMIKNRYTN